jgi:phage terminase small subunit
MDANDSSATAPFKRLSPKARRFVAEYLKDCNGTQAAIRAGYSPAGAAVRASEMLRNLTVSTAIREAHQEILKENQISVARIVHELALIAFFDPASILDKNGHLIPLGELPAEVRRGLPAIEYAESPDGARKVRFPGKLAALIALGRHMAIFTNRIGDDPTDLPPFNPDDYLDDDDEESASPIPKAAAEPRDD